MFDNMTFSQQMSKNIFNKIKQLIETSTIMGSISDEDRQYTILAPQSGIHVRLMNSIRGISTKPGYSAFVTLLDKSADTEHKTVVYQEDATTSATARLFDIAEQKYEEQERARKQERELAEKASQEEQEQKEANEKAILETVESALDSLFK